MNLIPLLFRCGLLAWLLGLPPLATAGETGLPFPQGLLFRVEKPGLPPSHIFGSMHTDDPRATRLPPQVLEALDESTLVATEILLDQDHGQQAKSALIFDDGRELRAILGPRLYARTVQAAFDHGLPETLIRHCKPWAVVSLLSAPRPRTGLMVDLVIAERAKTQGKEIHGLESVEEQIQVFDRLSDADQIFLLLTTLDRRYDYTHLHEVLLRTYLQRDLAGLVRLSQELMAAADEDLERRLLAGAIDNRNLVMTARILPLLERGRAFIAVGALHLPGNQGILALLSQEGYQVTQVY